MVSEQAIPFALALGANIGDRLAALRGACAALGEVLTITAVSPVYETPPSYVTDQPAFLNAALCGSTTLGPQVLLDQVKLIEQELGRRPTFRYGPRVIDIDIVFYDAMTAQTATLILPHPLMAEREFVLRPLAKIAPDWPHPVTGVTVAAMLAALSGPPTARQIEATL